METRMSVKGVLHDQSGRPVSDAIVMIAQGPSHNDIASVTNDSGEFYLTNIAVPGHYILQIRTNEGSVQKDVNLSSNEVIHLTY